MKIQEFSLYVKTMRKQRFKNSFKTFLTRYVYFLLQKVLQEKAKPLRTLKSLSEEERKLIEREGRDKYLDQGEFFDGYFFRDVEGHVL